MLDDLGLPVPFADGKILDLTPEEAPSALHMTECGSSGNLIIVEESSLLTGQPIRTRTILPVWG